MVTPAVGSPQNAVASLTVVGTVEGITRAEQVLQALQEAGFAPDQVSLMTRDNGITLPTRDRNLTTRDAELGATEIGVLGGVAGWLRGVSALALPGIGPIVGIGILWTTLVGGGIGAAAGGLGGALIRHGIDSAHARQI